MKKLTLILGLLFFATQMNIAHSNFQEQVEAEIKFDKTLHDFGQIKKDAEAVKCVFTYTNTGNDMLFITRVVKSCGCTEPEYSREPVMPGQSAKIEVGYTATDKIGTFNKKLTVFTNAATESVILTIKGEVVEN